MPPNNETNKKRVRQFVTRTFNMGNILDVISHELTSAYKELNSIRNVRGQQIRRIELRAIIKSLSKILTT